MRAQLPILFLLLIAAIGCEEQKPSTAEQSAPQQQTDLPQVTEAANLAVWQQGDVLLQHSRDQIGALRTATQQFLANPKDLQLAALKTQWHKAHNSLLAFSYLFAVADAQPGLFVQLETRRERLDGWPIQPGYLDYYDVYTHSGLVNDIAVPVTAKALRAAHQQFDSSDLTLGFHPIAYLLWGENGQRPISDFQPQQSPPVPADSAAGDIPQLQDLPNNRRRALLGLMAELLVDEIASLQQQWQGNGKHRKIFSGLNTLQQAELLRAAALNLIERQLIENQLQPALHQISQPDAELILHNSFSGQARGILQAQLKGLHTLLEADSEGLLLLSWTQAEASVWFAHLDKAQRAIDKLPEDGRGTETQWVAAIAALQQLAQPLKSEALVKP